ncbi:MAG: histidine kinase, partial [bacterium]|nr:histidine kinase [bacterium]
MNILDTAQLQDEFGSGFAGFHRLLPRRVQDMLLVCSLYESFILEEDGLVADLISSEFVELNLSHAPRVSRASTGHEALELISEREFDLVITMTRLGGWDVRTFAEEVKRIRPNVPVIVLAEEPRELARYTAQTEHRGAIDQFFVWRGDAKILLAIIKYVEDELNAEHDTRVGNVRVVILVENSVRFYSAYLPLIYTELMKQTQMLMSESLNCVQKLLRMRARPKILLAETFEDAWELYSKYKDYLLGVISDVRFPRGDGLDPEAGFEFIRRVRTDAPLMPVLLQSSDATNQARATELGACFLHKRSHTLLHDLRSFIVANLGFGDFVFRLSDGSEVARASDLRDLVNILPRVPEESVLFHAGSNHFSNWLMARSEFELAARIRPRTVTEFGSVGELRDYLVATLREFDERSQAGIISDFSRRRFSAAKTFTRIGGGSIGGKARGLAFVNALMKQHDLRSLFPGVRIAVPNSAAIGTAVFDAFLEENRLLDIVAADPGDEEIYQAFISAKLPAGVHGDLAAFLSSVRYPLAVRSSSLLEDSLGQPFAGVYSTHMLPNNHFNLGFRLDQLCDAIKLVYASTFTRSARRYLEVTGHRAEEEKMGVILQEIVGAQYEDCFYPTFSGVVRSYNYYPFGKLQPSDGIACVALGLGEMVVEGGEFLMFAPPHPHVLPQFATTNDLLTNSQRQFYALDMGHPERYPTPDADANILTLGLDVAERHGTLASVGSVYSPENDAVYDGVTRSGPRLVTFAHVLKSDVFPLANILQVLLEIGRRGMACPIEIEFAVNMKAKPMEFGFLQIRPTV